MNIHITPEIAINDTEIQIYFVRSSGPGGQHINKVATAVQLRFDVGASPTLPRYVKSNLAAISGRRLTQKGVLVIDAHRYRSQEQNRKSAMNRLVGLLKNAAVRPKIRRKTKPRPIEKLQRLATKHHRGRLKQKRRRVTIEDD